MTRIYLKTNFPYLAPPMIRIDCYRNESTGFLATAFLNTNASISFKVIGHINLSAKFPC